MSVSEEKIARPMKQLVRLNANGSFGLLLGSDETDSCEVELLGPEEEEYSIRVPRANLLLQEMIGPGDAQAARKAALRATFVRLDVGWGIQVPRAFTAYFGRNEDQKLELWYEGGLRHAERVAALAYASGQQRSLLEALAELVQDANAPQESSLATDSGAASLSLDGWRWSLELFAGSHGLTAQGSNAAPDSLRRLVESLGELGCGCAWDAQEDAPRNVDA